MDYEVLAQVEFTLRFEADDHEQAEDKLKDTLDAIRLMDGVSVIHIAHNL
jgi:hypothetical protein